MLRREGLFSTDLARIRHQVKEGALQRLSAKPGRKQHAVETESYDAIKRELQDKERAMADQSVELAILRKNEWGFVGPIAKQWIKEQTKLDILAVIKSSQHQGVSVRRSCVLLAIDHRRVIRWQHQARQGQGLANLTPGQKEPLHRILPKEIDQIIAMAKSQEYVDLSHRILAVTACDKGLFQASFSTVYRVLKENNLMTARGPGGAHNGNSKAPVRKDLTGPNQRWCWDISYLMTLQKGVYLYLYLLLDEWSRKAIQWRISWQQTADESVRLLEGGLVAENILDLPEHQRPEIISDRGRQMKAKPIQKLCEDHAMPQLFARPRTPMTIRLSSRPSVR